MSLPGDKPDRNGAAAYGGPCRLSERHLADLQNSGLTDATIAAAGVYTERDPAKVAKLLNWKSPASRLGDCLVFPVLGPDGQPTGGHVLRPDSPRTAAREGKPPKSLKYENPRGVPAPVYFPPGTADAPADPAAMVCVTEGIKKSLAAAQNGFPCVGLAGVWNWCRKRGPGTRRPSEVCDAWRRSSGRTAAPPSCSTPTSPATGTSPGRQRTGHRAAEGRRDRGERRPAGRAGRLQERAGRLPEPPQY